ELRLPLPHRAGRRLQRQHRALPEASVRGAGAGPALCAEGAGVPPVHLVAARPSRDGDRRRAGAAELRRLQARTHRHRERVTTPPSYRRGLLSSSGSLSTPVPKGGAPARKIFLAAFTSRSSTRPQEGQRWVRTDRLFWTYVPQRWHCCVVRRAGTRI